MFIIDQSTADYENLHTHRDASVLPLPAGIPLRSLDNAPQTARGRGDGASSIPRNGFVVGLFFSLPICLLLWAIILWVLHAVLF